MGIEFLKSLFTDGEGKEKSLSFTELEEALSKSDKIKLANLSDGGYVDKGKFDSKVSEISQLNTRISELEKAAESFKGVDVNALKEEVNQTKIKSALQIALIKNMAVDVDYLVYKAQSSDKKLDIDDKGNVTGIDELVASLKTSCPTMFAKKGKENKIEEIPLEGGENNEGITKSDILKKPYSERLKIYNNDPEKFNEIMKG